MNKIGKFVVRLFFLVNLIIAALVALPGVLLAQSNDYNGSSSLSQELKQAQEDAMRYNNALVNEAARIADAKAAEKQKIEQAKEQAQAIETRAAAYPTTSTNNKQNPSSAKSNPWLKPNPWATPPANNFSNQQMWEPQPQAGNGEGTAKLPSPPDIFSAPNSQKPAENNANKTPSSKPSTLKNSEY